MYSVYALVDPRDHAVRYVGMSKNVWRRYAMHLLTSGKSSPVKTAWVEELRQTDLSPLLEILETVETVEEAGQRETYWILSYLQDGANLLNVSKTGVRSEQKLIVGEGDVETIARGLKMSVDAVLKLIYKKDLPARKTDEGWVVDQSEFDHWLATKSNQNKPTSK